MLCATMMQATLLLAGADASADAAAAKPVESLTYAEAHDVAEKTGKPMVVMVGTDWCSPCQTMKRRILPRVRAHGMFRRVSYAVVNPDQDGELANEITGGGPIPQLVMFRKTDKGWVRKKLVGGQSVEDVEEFINEGLASDAKEKKSDKTSHDAKPASHG
jgi:thioredoxin-like negative regulator of GroEL